LGVQAVFEHNPSFRHFRGVDPVYEFGSCSPNKKRKHENIHKKEQNPNIIPSYYLSYQGGGDYRGVYDIGFKRGFMGYIGLLLNDPYKRDRIDG
jgi:hypothetical protein